MLDNAYLRLGDTTKIKTENILKRSDKDKRKPGYHELRIMRNPNYLGYAARILFGVDLLPEQCVILEELWTRPFPMYIASRGFGKSWLTALYAMLKMALTPPGEAGQAGCKIVIVGAAFRQSKVIFEYMQTLWNNAPILRSICDQKSGPKKDVDRCTMQINDNWCYAVPLGDGSKIRGLRATIIIADEFASIPPDIYETVVQGFASVSANPVGGVKDYAKRELLKAHGLWDEISEEQFQAKSGNQIIISGTADYDFKHYADYWKKYCTYVNSLGELTPQVKEYLGEDADLEHFDWKHYGVIRIPYELIPKGFMDDRVVMRAKATVHSGIYQMEYGAVFTTDSNGFFRRSLIEACVAHENNNIILHPDPTIIEFDAMKHGSPKMKYVYGVDPASEEDNFSITILELHANHTRVVHCWTTNRADFKKRARAGLTDANDYYGYCARKIRDLMRIFPTEHIGIDAQGGGIALLEALGDPDKIRPDEVPIYEIIEESKEKDTDILRGKHIVELCQFAKYDWTRDANHGLRKDMEDKVLLFPRFDPLVLANATEDAKIQADMYAERHPGKSLTMYDTLEDCVLEIEELKNELTTIVVTVTGTGVNMRERWDTPEVKLENGKKGRLRKDRYSSLVIANMIARQIHRTLPDVEYEMVGGFSKDVARGVKGEMYKGPAWFADAMNDLHR